jgi:hypothetical protein
MADKATTGERRRPRRLRSFALVAVLVTVLVSALPGTASAGWGGQITPVLNCYYPNTDGSVTAVLGYRSTYTGTQRIAVGNQNYATPSKYSTSLPTVFKPGTNNGVATMRVAAADLAHATWYVDGATLSYWNLSSAVPVCTQAQLPAFANGATVAIALLVAGLVGVLAVRRVRRNLLQPCSSNPSAQGGHNA